VIVVVIVLVVVLVGIEVLIVVVVVLISPWKVGHRNYDGIKQDQSTCTDVCT
jgi:quinol-cytochrome oxidoreductase complex cytochrome b subunit